MVEAINNSITSFRGTIVSEKIRFQLGECKNNKDKIKRLYVELNEMGLLNE